ncbi:response regulator transcription factor [bacterium]|nr:response regulator transcription factor [bacterium]
MIELLIADDHTLFREGLRQILDAQSDINVVDEVNDGSEAISKVQDYDYDVLLLDISMPGRSGLEVLGQLRGIKPKLNILVLSMYSEEQYAFRALKAGASGYLTKRSAPQELLAAIRKVAFGRKYISPEVAEQVVFELSGDSQSPVHHRLSNREFQVMTRIASGQTVGEIAKEWSLSTSTISTVRTRIMTKMKMKTNAEITCYAVRNGLVD